MSGKAFTGIVCLGFWMFDVSGKVIYRCCILGFLDVWPTFRLVTCVMYLGFWMFEVSDKLSYRCYLLRFLDFKTVWSFRYCQLSHLSFVYLRVSLCVCLCDGCTCSPDSIVFFCTASLPAVWFSDTMRSATSHTSPGQQWNTSPKSWREHVADCLSIVFFIVVVVVQDCVCFRVHILHKLSKPV